MAVGSPIDKIPGKDFASKKMDSQSYLDYKGTHKDRCIAIEPCEASAQTKEFSIDSADSKVLDTHQAASFDCRSKCAQGRRFEEINDHSNDSINEMDSEDSLKLKIIQVIQNLLLIGYEFSEEVLHQIRQKIDPDESPSVRSKITLKILKTKLRKSRRKDKARINPPNDDYLNSKISQMNASKKSSRNQGGSLTGEFEADEILHKLISSSEKSQEISSLGGQLLSLITPKPMGLYWINNVKFSEIKSIWRRRLLKARQEKKPEGFPAVVPHNYRLNISKKPLPLPIGFLGISKQ